MPLPTDPSAPPHNRPAPNDLRAAVRELIGARRLPPTDILGRLAGGPHATRAMVRSAIRELVAAGELAYTFEHGRTFLEPSFDRPVRVGERIVLVPAGKEFRPEPADVVVRLMPGAAFGGGRHPTTRLALRGIEFALSRPGRAAGGPGSRVLDIGTGTGVLAIAAVKLGLDSGLGIDIDPCAVAEAKANVRLNNLEGRIAVSDSPFEGLSGPYDMVAANLRSPSLMRLAASVAALLRPGAVLVMSGLRREEGQKLLVEYRKRSFEKMWWDDEDDWVGLALGKIG